MVAVHVLRVFTDPEGRGGNPLAVFLDGAAIPEQMRLAVAAELGYSETVFVDDVNRAEVRIFSPSRNLRSRAIHSWEQPGYSPMKEKNPQFCVHRRVT